MLGRTKMWLKLHLTRLRCSHVAHLSQLTRSRTSDNKITPCIWCKNSNNAQRAQCKRPRPWEFPIWASRWIPHQYPFHCSNNPSSTHNSSSNLSSRSTNSISKVSRSNRGNRWLCFHRTQDPSRPNSLNEIHKLLSLCPRKWPTWKRYLWSLTKTVSKSTVKTLKESVKTMKVWSKWFWRKKKNWFNVIDNTSMTSSTLQGKIWTFCMRLISLRVTSRTMSAIWTKFS